MSRTGDQVLQAVGEVIHDHFASTTTSAGASDGTSIIDTALRQYGDNKLVGRYIRLGTTGRVVRRIIRNTQSSGTATLAEPFAAQVASGVAYQLHRYKPADKFLAIDKARLEDDIMESLFNNVLDDTTTCDGISNVFDIPAAVTQGPHLVFVEDPMPSYAAQWNFLTNPLGNSTTGYTSTSLTATVIDRTYSDLLVPKYDQQAMKFAVATLTNGTLKQVLASMANSITAAKSAGRKMTYAEWVYCLIASRVSLKITDDAGTTTGTAHQGKGWELLYVERDISATNATTLTVTLDVTNASGAVTGYRNRGWFYFGGKERVCDSIFNVETGFKPRIDDTSRHVILNFKPTRGYQLRMQGKAPLTSLGTDLDTQATGTTEVDVQTQEVLAVKAAELLLQWNAIDTDDVASVKERIAAVRARLSGVKREWNNEAPRPHLRNPFAN